MFKKHQATVNSFLVMQSDLTVIQPKCKLSQKVVNNAQVYKLL